MKKILLSFLSVIIMCTSGLTITVNAEENNSSNQELDFDKNFLLIATPIVVPVIIVGGMVLQSRQKKSSTEIEDYMKEEYVLEICKDVRIETETVLESKNKPIDSKPSYTKSADNLQKVSLVIDAFKESGQGENTKNG